LVIPVLCSPSKLVAFSTRIRQTA